MKKLIKLYTGRFVWISLAILLQVGWTFLILFFLSANYAPVSAVLTLLSLLILIPIIERPASPEVKMAWAIPILIFPFFGGILYLIIDSAMQSALTLAAKRGVDVRIVLPAIPDKKVVNQVTKSHYAVLLESGVSIYEYSPGFIHEKCLVCDGKIATVGTVNLDYRSLYLHYENGCVFYGGDIIDRIRDNLQQNFAVSTRITQVNKRQRLLLTRIYYAIIRLFAPVM